MNAARGQMGPREPGGMQFLKTLFWVLVAVIAVLFAVRNWTPVTLNLWGDIQADIKIPILLLFFFLLGWLPTWAVMRTRLWSYRRRLDVFERGRAAVSTPQAAAEEPETAP